MRWAVAWANSGPGRERVQLSGKVQGGSRGHLQTGERNNRGSFLHLYSLTLIEVGQDCSICSFWTLINLSVLRHLKMCISDETFWADRFIKYLAYKINLAFVSDNWSCKCLQFCTFGHFKFVLLYFQRETNESIRAYEMSNYRKKKEQFDSIFDPEIHRGLVARGERRLSLKALQVSSYKPIIIET